MTNDAWPVPTVHTQTNQNTTNLTTKTMASITDFPTADLTWGDVIDKGTFQLKRVHHPKGFLALQLPPATLTFDVEDPNSRFPPKRKLRVNGGLVDWLRELDDKVKGSLEGHLKDHPYEPCLQDGPYGCQLEVKPMNGTNVWLYDAEGRKTRGSFADLKRGVTVSVKASGFGIVPHRNELGRLQDLHQRNEGLGAPRRRRRVGRQGVRVPIQEEAARGLKS